MGAGANLPFYSSQAIVLVGLEPAPRLMEMTREAAKRAQVTVELISASAENIPFADHEFDTVVTTWTLCSIPDVAKALSEMRRVLKPQGRLLFVEHGLAPEQSVRKWQDRLTPVWKCIGGGCHLNRPIRDLIQGNGFAFDRLHTGYMRGPKAMTYMYEGSAISD